MESDGMGGEKDGKGGLTVRVKVCRGQQAQEEREQGDGILRDAF
jgi:hypothetical protein